MAKLGEDISAAVILAAMAVSRGAKGMKNPGKRRATQFRDTDWLLRRVRFVFGWQRLLLQHFCRRIFEILVALPHAFGEKIFNQAIDGGQLNMQFSGF